MISHLRRPVSILLAFLLALVYLSTPVAPAAPMDSNPAQSATATQSAQEQMPDELMSAFLAASSQPFEANAEGYRARSGGLEFSLGADGLLASGEGLTWGLALCGLGRGGQMAALPGAEIVQVDGRLEYRRGALTEWYGDTALGMEQGFTIHEALPGEGMLVLQLDLSSGLRGELDADGGGLSFTSRNGQTLRYDHLRAWDANGVRLDASLGYAPGQVTIQVRDQGVAYPITIDPLIFVEQKVSASDGEVDDRFGVAAALYGDTALVGADYDDIGADNDQGSAYVFVRNGTTWTEQAQLIASDGVESDSFGVSVALYSDTALVGAPGDDTGSASNKGSAYVFTRSGTTWTQQQKLTASDGAGYDYFGYSVALYGDTALVGADEDNVSNTDQGSAYVFVRSGTNWTQQKKLTASDSAAYDYFGYSVAIYGNTALVGAYGDDVGVYTNQGSAYVFTRSGTTWTQQQKLTASDGAGYAAFGVSAALWGDTALVGANGANSYQGAAYVFTRSGTTWTQQQKLTASDGEANDWFGWSAALSGDTALVGATMDTVGVNVSQGSAYIFTRSGTSWTQQAKLTASDGAVWDSFGSAAALSGNTALVGAMGSNGKGAAYFYQQFGFTIYLPLVLKSP